MEWIETAWDSWKKILSVGDVCTLDKVVMLASNDMQTNITTITLLNKYIIINGVSKVVFVSCEAGVAEIVNEYAGYDYLVVLLTKVEISAVVRLFSVTRFTDQLLINDTMGFFDADPYSLSGICRITNSEIIEAAFLDMKIDANFTIPQKTRNIRYKRIDWDNDKFGLELSNCRNYKDILERLIERGTITKQKKIYLFGLSKVMQSLYEMMEDYNLRGIIDNYPKSEHYKGLKVFLPDDFECSKDGDTCILVVSRHYRQICEQLRYLGFEYGKTVFVVRDEYLEKHESLDSKKRKLYKEIKEGKKAYEGIRKRYPTGRMLISPMSGTGDVLFASQYSCNHSFFVCRFENCSRVARALGKETITLGEDDILNLVSYLRADDCEDHDYKVVNYCYNQELIVRLSGYKGIDFNTFIQRALYNSTKRVSSERFEQCSSDYLFQTHGLHESRTVLLSPYSNFSEDIPEGFWEDIASFFLSLGCDVCTNIGGQEKPVKGTIGINIPYSQVLDFVDKAGLFVGVRSGLCDLLAATSSEMIVIYPNRTASNNGVFFDFFSLIRMGIRKEKVFEILFENVEQCMNDIQRIMTSFDES